MNSRDKLGVQPHRQLNKQAGYTLLELLVVLLIVFILLTLLIWFKETAALKKA